MRSCLPPAARGARAATGFGCLVAAVVAGVVLAAPQRAGAQSSEEPTAADAAEPAAADSAGDVTAAPLSGVVELSSRISPVDACNRAQVQRPAGATVTDMAYERAGQPGERVFTCRISWSMASDASPTGRPILFGPLR